MERDTRHIVVRFTEDRSREVEKIVSEVGGRWSGQYVAGLQMISVAVGDADPEVLLQRYAGRPEVRHAYFPPIMERRDTYQPTCSDVLVSDRSGQTWTQGRQPSGWAFRRVNAHHAWKYTTGNAAIKIAVVDSGLSCDANGDPHHADLLTPDGTGSRGYTPGTVSAYTHGQNCYSAACGAHSGGVTRGMAPDCTKLFYSNDYNEENENYYLISVLGLTEAAAAGAHLVNISWGWYNWVYNENEAANPEFVDLKDACDAIFEAGGLVFVAGGNLGHLSAYQNHDTVAVYPNEFPNVVEIAAVSATPWDTQPDNRNQTTDNATSGNASEYGHGFPLLAPGKLPLASTRNEESNGAENQTGGIYYGGGTSFASPFAVGCAALAWSINPSLTNVQLRQLLYDTADQCRMANFRTYYPDSYGVINAGKAVAKARSTLPANSGVPIPYLGVLNADCREMTAFDVDGVGTTTLSGTVYIDIAGFCDDTITSVELWQGNYCIYSGSPSVLTKVVPSSGDLVPLTIIAKTGTSETSETYLDILSPLLVERDAPTTTSSISTGLHPFNSRITLSEVGTDASQPLKYYYRWD